MTHPNNHAHSSYPTGGRNLAGYVAVPKGGGGSPGILVCHEGSGLSDFTRERADALAALGYTAFAPDLFGEALTSREAGGAFIRALVTDGLRARIQDAHAHLKTIKG